NLASVVILFMSGLNISNAHRYLYWGDWGFSPDQAWLAVHTGSVSVEASSSGWFSR
ncbi:MAG: hypothetical protein RLZZ11_2130, partial [Cyanobacteriota bacterium]